MNPLTPPRMSRSLTLAPDSLQVGAAASFWPNSETTTCIQVHTAEDAKIVKRMDGSKRIAYAVRGKALEVYEVAGTVSWVSGQLKTSIPGANEVWGGDWSDEGHSAFSTEKRATGQSETFDPQIP